MAASRSTLLCHTGGRYLTREDLRDCPTPEPTKTWVPVAHHQLVGSLVLGLENSGITIDREQYAVSGREDARLFGVMDLTIPDLTAPDYKMAIGLRASNDRSFAISATAGVRVFVCDNLAFAGDGGVVVFNRKHTSRLDLAEIIPPAIDRYLEKAGALRLDIDRMKDRAISDSQAKEIIFDAFARPRPLLPSRLFRGVAKLYFDDDEQRAKFPDRSLWSLNNAFTGAVKDLLPVPQTEGGIAIGRYFARITNRLRGVSVAIPEVPEGPPADDDHGFLGDPLSS